jgi:hypothetical protein
MLWEIILLRDVLKKLLFTCRTGPREVVGDRTTGGFWSLGPRGLAIRLGLERWGTFGLLGLSLQVCCGVRHGEVLHKQESAIYLSEIL